MWNTLLVASTNLAECAHYAVQANELRGYCTAGAAGSGLANNRADCESSLGTWNDEAPKLLHQSLIADNETNGQSACTQPTTTADCER